MKPYKAGWLIGAAGGIGSQFATVLTEWCENVCSADKERPGNDPSRLDQFLCADMSDEDGVAEFTQFARQSASPPEVLVIAAGDVHSMHLSETKPDEIDAIYRNNFRLVALSLAAFKAHCPRDPSVGKAVVVVSSNAGLVARPSQSVYAAMKAAVISLVRSLAVDWGPSGIRANIIAPGTVVVQRNEAALRAKLPNLPGDPSRPLQRVALPIDLVPALELLLNPHGLLTGEVIVVDGGSSLTARQV